MNKISYGFLKKGDQIIVFDDKDPDKIKALLTVKYIMCRYNPCEDYPYGWVSVDFSKPSPTGETGLQGNFNRHLYIKAKP